MRTIKFRAWDNVKFKMYYVGESEEVIFELDSNGIVATDITEHHWGFKKLEHLQYMQFTGLHDKNGKEIYEGDIIRVRQADRHEQTHTGDNIPLGSYTEPLEPYIKVWNQVVTFKDGMFGLDKGDDDWFTPLIWLIEESQVEEYELCDIFRGRECDWEDDLDYLLQEYSLSSAQELINFLGIEVIGNKFDNPELLEQTT